MMNKILFGILMIVFVGCEKEHDTHFQYMAKIVDYDLNCSTCVISFADDSQRVVNDFGESVRGFYHACNLDKNDFEIGQWLKLNVRKAKEEEVKLCITLYPSYPYKNVYVEDYTYYKGIVYNDTIEIGYKECLKDEKNNLSVCFDSLISDSRCPEDVVCVWPGEAVAKFTVNIDQQDPLVLEIPTGTQDTLVPGYSFSFVDLLPYPHTQRPIDLEDYKAMVVVREL
ncbi:hypothetical protein E9993_17440 [Labilibacter sediminis]|nr:hypothetical protein E9993_17440 [Labilibacter sediminis]